MGSVLHVQPRRAGWPILPLVAGAFGAGGLLVAWLHLDRLPVTLCLFKATTGIPCMTCGTTRALGRLGAFDPLGAFVVNPLATAVFLGLAVYAAVDLILWTRGTRLELGLTRAQKAWLLGLGLALLFLNWAYLIWARV